MAKSKLKTPDWILKGGKKPAKKKEEKTFKIKKCPKCNSDDVGVMITGEECRGGKCDWECRKCKWTGKDIKEDEVSEDEFLEYLDKKGETLPSENELKKDFKKTIESSDEEDFEG